MSSLTVWRIANASRAAAIFTGEGGLHVEGRWHSKGRRIVYAAESRSLAALEIMANIPGRDQLRRHTWVIAHAVVPDALIDRPARVPEDWRSVPASDSTRDLGDAWLLARRCPALRVPSAVILGEFNYLLNPLHPEFSLLQFSPPEPFSFDPRF